MFNRPRLQQLAQAMGSAAEINGIDAARAREAVEKSGYVDNLFANLDRYARAGHYDPISNPAGGVVRAIVENAGASGDVARRVEQLGTGAVAGSVGLAGIGAALDALRQDQTPGTILINN